MATYTRVPDGEKINRTTNVDGSIVTVTGGIRRKAGAPQYRFEWVLDFNGVTNDELLQLAARTVAIAYQRVWRDLATDVERMSWEPPTVREYLDTERRRGSVGGIASIQKQLSECKTEKEKIAKLKELGIL